MASSDSKKFVTESSLDDFNDFISWYKEGFKRDDPLSSEDEAPGPNEEDL